VRSHAKASSAGSSMRRDAGHIFRALFALVGLLLALALTATPALAAKTHLYTGTSFGPDGTAASSFTNAQGLAIDQTSGNVYVYDVGAGGKVYKFDAAGNPVNFSGLTSNVIEGVGGSSGGEEELAIAPAGAIGGTAGDIYVANNQVVKIYAPSGGELGQINGIGETCGVATDPAGHLFIGIFPSAVREYTPTANPATGADLSGESSASLPGICNVAADGLGNVYATNYTGAKIAKLEGLADPSPTLTEPGAPSIAIDPSNNDLYADRNSEVAQYSSAGELIGTFGSEQLSSSFGLGVNGTTGKVYVNGASGRVAIYGPAVTVANVSADAPSGVGLTKATLNGTVNPEGLAVTECKFEYGTDTSYGSSVPCEGAIPTDSADHAVTGAITGLTPGATYHFRLAATNANGTNKSSGRTFATPTAAVTEEATNVIGTKATLHGAVIPDNEAVTECKFEYGTDASYGSSVPCEGSTPADEDSHPVTAALSGLTPNGATYHFRLVIVRPSGTDQGLDKSFTTAPTVITNAPSGFAGTTATLNGTLRPEGSEFTECKFEYGLTNSYGSTASCAESVSSIGTGFGPVPVHAPISGLKSGTTYHYRLVGTNTAGTVQGADETLITLGPQIGAEFADQIGASEATLHAQVNPENELTSYHFEYGTQGPCASNPCISIPAPDASAGGGSGNVPVSVSLSGLEASTTYHFRLVASNSSGTSEGPDATFVTYLVSSSFGSCSNDVFRNGGPSASLPDCRAYEQASPVDKNGADVSGGLEEVQASTDGNAVAYFAPAGLPGAAGAQDFETFLSRREGSSWSTHGVYPSAADASVVANAGWTPDLSQFFSLAGPGFGGQRTLRMRSSADGSFTPMTILSRSTGAFAFEGASADGSKVFFSSSIPLIPDPGSAPEPDRLSLYVWDRDTGVVSLAGVLPDSDCASPPCIPQFGSFAGAFNWFESTRLFFRRSGGADQDMYVEDEHAISDSGEEAFFTAGRSGQLYLRKHAASPGATTVHVSASQRGTPDPEGTKAVEFMRATPSGSTAFFLSCEKLTDDSTAYSPSPELCDPQENGVEGSDLYAYDTASGHLSDLTVDPTDPHGAEVKGVLGASDDGSYVYFAANGDLDGDGPATPGDCQGWGNFNFLNFTGSCSIYVWHDGASTFVARVPGEKGAGNWQPLKAATSGPTLNTSRVSGDGRTLVFSDGQPSQQLYRYHFDDPEPVCISCNPTGAPTSDAATLQSIAPYLIITNPPGSPPILPRNLSADGNRVFFETQAKLVAGDTNGVQDVYEWEAEGTGSCESDDEDGGCLYLLSTGTGGDPAYFGDASVSGNDVFIFSRDAMVPRDKDQLLDVYDVRVDGGLVSQHPSEPPACSGDACRGRATSPSNQPGAGTAVFSGPGNPPVTRHKARKRHHKKKRHHRHAAKHGHATKKNGGAK
jgi:hypothetical protein